MLGVSVVLPKLKISCCIHTLHFLQVPIVRPVGAPSTSAGRYLLKSGRGKVPLQPLQ